LGKYQILIFRAARPPAPLPTPMPYAMCSERDAQSRRPVRYVLLVGLPDDRYFTAKLAEAGISKISA